jgi:para-nitrobenzyl esterase
VNLKSMISIFGLGAVIVLTTLPGSSALAKKAPPPKPPTVTVESGRVVGVTSNEMNQFLGIPYALPPTGDRRWTPPTPYKKFPGGSFKADQFPNECPQPGSTGNENCLFLNVFTPPTLPDADGDGVPPAAEVSSGGGLAVMVWIHQGGLVTGSGMIDPQRIVADGVIVVSVNYRLGYLGFFAHPAIDGEDHLHGNYGLMDQQLALQWVQNNIGAFGGDPTKVTIFGESAGGQSVYAHLASPTAAQLFRGAIAESGSYAEFQDYFDFIVPLATGETAGTTLVPSGESIASSVGCSKKTTKQTVNCLRKANVSKLVALEPGTIYPFVDGTILTQTPGAAFASGQFNKVPVISGSNHDEYRLFVALQYDLGVGPLTDAEYPAAVAAFAGQPFGSTRVQALLAEYPLSNFPPPAGVMSAPLALGALGTDDLFSCPVRNADLVLAPQVPVYAYEFHDETAPAVLPEQISFPLGDAHEAELFYLFGDTPQDFLTPNQIVLSDFMLGYWTQFAKTLDPNSSGAPVWPQYSAGGSFESLIAPTPETESDASFDTDHNCSSFWNTN